MSLGNQRVSICSPLLSSRPYASLPSSPPVSTALLPSNFDFALGGAHQSLHFGVQTVGVKSCAEVNYHKDVHSVIGPSFECRAS